MRMLLWTLLFICATTNADDTPTTRVIARARIVTPQPIVAGQQARLEIEILTTTWFLRAPEMPNLDLPNAAVTLEEQGVSNMNTEIGGVKWFGLTRTYLVTPNDGGDIRIPPIEITTYPGLAKGVMKARTAALVLPVKAIPRPPGTENALASTRLAITQHVTPAPAHLRVGDVITRTVTISADGTHGMFLPPITFRSTTGLAMYPKVPDVQELSDTRMGFLGSRRTDSATYVVMHEGEYELPAVEVIWWNTRIGRLEKASAPPVKFSALPNPAYKPEFGLPVEPETEVLPPNPAFDWVRTAGIAALTLVVLFTAWITGRVSLRLGRAVSQRLTAWRNRRHASEAFAFRRVLQACRTDRAAVCHDALRLWLERFHLNGAYIGLDALRHAANDPELDIQIAALEVKLFARTPLDDWRPRVFRARLKLARRRVLATDTAHRRQSALPPLDPSYYTHVS